jgi:tRNA (guanine-N7-)-methyltransferase
MHRTVKSYVCRNGRLTAAQQRAFDQYYLHWGLPVDSVWDLNDHADQRRLSEIPSHPVILEIGFGQGDSLFEMAARDPTHHYIGVEIYRAGVGQILARLAKTPLHNLQICCADAIEVMQHCVPHHALAGIQLFFPDPWPKKRHHKRRIVQKAFLDLAAVCLVPGGFISIATDWQPYADSIQTMMASDPRFQRAASVRDRGMVTRFEARGQRLGHRITDLKYIRVS